MAMLSSPESEEPRCSTSNNPLFVHRRIEDDIEHFVENFKQKSSVLDRRLSSDSGDSSGWTSSVFSATDTPSTDSPDRDGELLPLPEEDVHGRNGIIAESRRIAQWALRQSRYASSRDSCTCTYHPKIGECTVPCSVCRPEEGGGGGGGCCICCPTRLPEGGESCACTSCHPEGGESYACTPCHPEGGESYACTPCHLEGGESCAYSSCHPEGGEWCAC